MAMDELRTVNSMQSPSGVTRGESGNHTKKTHGGLIVTLAIILIALVAVLWFSDGNIMQQTDGPREIAPGQILTDAPDGTVIADFPTELLLEPGVATDSSYSIAYAGDNTSQPVVSYRSAKTLEENIAMYDVFLDTNGWDVTHHADANEAPATFFYAYKDNAEVNITLVSDASGVMVTIAYVLHQQ